MLRQPTAKTPLQKILNEKKWSRSQLQAQVFVKTGINISESVIAQLALGYRRWFPKWLEAIAATLGVSEIELTAPFADEEINPITEKDNSQPLA